MCILVCDALEWIVIAVNIGLFNIVMMGKGKCA